MVRTLNSGLRAKGPRRYTPKPKSKGVEVPAGDIDSRLAWVAEDDDLETRRSRGQALWEHEEAAGHEIEPDLLGEKLRDAVYDRVVRTESLETLGASGGEPAEADTTDDQSVPETTGVPSEGGIDSGVKDEVIQPLPGADLDEQIEETEGTAAEPEPETIPEGVSTIDALVDWVKAGDAPARAQIVLDQENTKPEDKRRKGLVSKLTDIILED